MTIFQPAYPPPSSGFTDRSSGDITQRVLHHSAGPITQTPLEIDAFERSRTDQPDPFIYIPYSFLAGPTAGDYHKPVLYLGRPPLYVEGATFGQHLQTVSICVIGNFEKTSAGYTGPPTDELKQLLVDWAVYVQRMFPGIDRTVGHNQTAIEQGYTDQCPGSDLIDFLPELRERVAKALGH